MKHFKRDLSRCHKFLLKFLLNILKMIQITYSDGFYIVRCPHCELLIQVKENEINCGIFRHAVLKSNGQQINPHTPKKACKKYRKNELVYGCAKPYQMIKENNHWIVRKCDYI